MTSFNELMTRTIKTFSYYNLFAIPVQDDAGMDSNSRIIIKCVKSAEKLKSLTTDLTVDSLPLWTHLGEYNDKILKVQVDMTKVDNRWASIWTFSMTGYNFYYIYSHYFYRMMTNHQSNDIKQMWYDWIKTYINSSIVSSMIQYFDDRSHQYQQPMIQSTTGYISEMIDSMPSSSSSLPAPASAAISYASESHFSHDRDDQTLERFYNIIRTAGTLFDTDTNATNFERRLNDMTRSLEKLKSKFKHRFMCGDDDDDESFLTLKVSNSDHSKLIIDDYNSLIDLIEDCMKKKKIKWITARNDDDDDFFGNLGRHVTAGNTRFQENVLRLYNQAISCCPPNLIQKIIVSAKNDQTVTIRNNQDYPTYNQLLTEYGELRAKCDNCNADLETIKSADDSAQEASDIRQRLLDMKKIKSEMTKSTQITEKYRHIQLILHLPDNESTMITELESLEKTFLPYATKLKLADDMGRYFKNYFKKMDRLVESLEFDNIDEFTQFVTKIYNIGKNFKYIVGTRINETRIEEMHKALVIYKIVGYNDYPYLSDAQQWKHLQDNLKTILQYVEKRSTTFTVITSDLFKSVNNASTVISNLISDDKTMSQCEFEKQECLRQLKKYSANSQRHADRTANEIELIEAGQTIDRKDREIKNLTAEVENIKQDRIDLQANLGRTQTNLTRKQTELDSLESQLTQERRHNKELSAQLAQVGDELERVKKKQRFAETELTTLKDEHSQSIQQEKRKFTHVETEMNEMRNANVKLAKDLAAVRDDNSRLNRENVKLVKDLTTLRDGGKEAEAKLLKDLAKIEQDKSRLERENEKLDDQVRIQAEKIQANLSKRTKLEQQTTIDLNKIRAENEKLIEDRAKIEAEGKDAQSKLLQTTIDLNKIRAENEKLIEDRAKIEAEGKDAQSNLLQELNKIRDANTKLIEDRAKIQAEEEEAQSKLLQATKDLNKIQKSVRPKIREELANLEKSRELERAQLQLDEITKELATLREQSHAELNRVKSELERDRHQEIQKLRTSYKKIENELKDLRVYDSRKPRKIPRLAMVSPVVNKEAMDVEMVEGAASDAWHRSAQYVRMGKPNAAEDPTPRPSHDALPTSPYTATGAERPEIIRQKIDDRHLPRSPYTATGAERPEIIRQKMDDRHTASMAVVSPSIEIKVDVARNAGLTTTLFNELTEMQTAAAKDDDDDEDDDLYERNDGDEFEQQGKDRFDEQSLRFQK